MGPVDMLSPGSSCRWQHVGTLIFRQLTKFLPSKCCRILGGDTICAYKRTEKSFATRDNIWCWWVTLAKVCKSGYHMRWRLQQDFQCAFLAYHPRIFPVVSDPVIEWKPGKDEDSTGPNASCIGVWIWYWETLQWHGVPKLEMSIEHLNWVTNQVPTIIYWNEYGFG